MKIRNRVSVAFEDDLALVSLERPEKRNALDLEMFQAIAESQRMVAGEAGVRAVILTGAGVDFCSGLDVKSLMKDRSGMRKLLWKWLPWRANLAQRVAVGWRRLPLPVIAAIQGRCWGGGMQIALGADFRLAAPDASLSIMEGKWGLIPDMGGTLALRELTKRDRATLLAMTAEQFGPEHALEQGLLTGISDDPAQSAREIAGVISQRSPDAVAAVKRLYQKSWTSGPGAALARETGYQLRIITGPNQRIAVRRQMGEERDYRPAKKW